MVKSLLNKIKLGRQKNKNTITEKNKLKRFKQHSTGRSNFLSTNASSKVQAKQKATALKEKSQQDKKRMQRRRSMATGEIMMDLMAARSRPVSATSRSIVQIEHYISSSSSSSNEDEDEDEDEDVHEKSEQEKQNDKDAEQEKENRTIQTVQDHQQVNQLPNQQPTQPPRPHPQPSTLKRRVATPPVLPCTVEKTKKYRKKRKIKTRSPIEYQKLSEKKGGLTLNGPPTSGLYVPAPILWGREQMNSFVDGRNQGCLPTFALNGNQMIFVSGFAERNQSACTYGFRPFCSESVRQSHLYNSNYDIVDVSCQSELRTLFVTRKRNNSKDEEDWYQQKYLAHIQQVEALATTANNELIAASICVELAQNELEVQHKVRLGVLLWF